MTTEIKAETAPVVGNGTAVERPFRKQGRRNNKRKNAKRAKNQAFAIAPTNLPNGFKDGKTEIEGKNRRRQRKGGQRRGNSEEKREGGQKRGNSGNSEEKKEVVLVCYLCTGAHKAVDCELKCRRKHSIRQKCHLPKQCIETCSVCQDGIHDERKCPKRCSVHTRNLHHKRDCPITCYRCQKPGHTAGSSACKKKQICDLCQAEDHEQYSCPERCVVHTGSAVIHTKDDCSVTCFSCDGKGHIQGSSACPNSRNNFGSITSMLGRGRRI